LGSTTSLLTYDQAANRLGCTKRSVHNYIERGLLKRVVQSGKVLVRRDDVEQLAEESGTDFPALNKKTVYQMLSRLKKLEDRYEMMTQIWDTLGLQEKPLRPEPKEAAQLHRAATDFLTVATYQLKEMQSWAGVFVRIDDAAVETVAEATGSLQPWRPFHDLAHRMLDHLEKQKALKTDIELQALQAKLQLGRRRVREAALFWIEAGRGSVPEQALRALDTPGEALLRDLGGKRA